jgi:hypothetical protein
MKAFSEKHGLVDKLFVLTYPHSHLPPVRVQV